ncbi:MAG: element excision factor XisH family protein [Dolichospermum sp.]|uniref:element excision factor XisH family protein n=1 Tax=Dolichospermum circinale TaxID=109265 RepID=UPI00047F422B|nr:element excision factor XisH family protein [Dolichospermum circinale]MBD1211851.1 XisH family protein [Dolichospermum circinale Clear-D4]MCE2717541.1 XisH family protein [Anabaena sp. 49628_E55]MDB9456127.1 element excision factor XisH family protein [Dolichospermum circinale CS-541/06]MDB9463851.1 element excision factor XisH family protein [Dolichospermum circinale CS-541/04]MDB9474566.1 element excision factor XisH family protein [Dolichospermum circinale CS-537/11]
MMAKDKFHDVVKNALIKEGWTITNDPLFIQFGGVDLYVDLGAEKMLAAQKDNEKIAVEIKSFLGDSTISDFHQALGQLLNYRLILRRQEPERILYLAVPFDIYESFFKLEFTQIAIIDYQLKIIVYNIDKEVISQWIN